MSNLLKPEDTRRWLNKIAAQALREAQYERRRLEFKQTLERMRRLRKASRLR